MQSKRRGAALAGPGGARFQLKHQLQGQLHLARTAVTERIAVGDVGGAGDSAKAGAVDRDVG